MTHEQIKSLALCEILKAVTSLRGPQRIEHSLTTTIAISGGPMDLCGPAIVDAAEFLVRFGVVHISVSGDIMPSAPIAAFVWDDLNASGRKRSELCEDISAPEPVTFN